MRRFLSIYHATDCSKHNARVVSLSMRHNHGAIYYGLSYWSDPIHLRQKRPSDPWHAPRARSEPTFAHDCWFRMIRRSMTGPTMT